MLFLSLKILTKKRAVTAVSPGHILASVSGLKEGSVDFGIRGPDPSVSS
jgi:hypothetical protein